jgi:hypothetical protein
VNEVVLDEREQEELYIILKPREKDLCDPLAATLRRIEHTLFQRLTIEEMERLASRILAEH